MVYVETGDDETAFVNTFTPCETILGKTFEFEIETLKYNKLLYKNKYLTGEH